MSMMMVMMDNDSDEDDNDDGVVDVGGCCGGDVGGCGSGVWRWWLWCWCFVEVVKYWNHLGWDEMKPSWEWRFISYLHCNHWNDEALTLV